MKEELLQNIDRLKNKALAEISAASNPQEADQCRVRYLGKKGEVTSLLKGLGGLEPQDRPEIGQRVNQLKNLLEDELGKTIQELQQNVRSTEIAGEKIDVTLPGRQAHQGHRHPIRQVTSEMCDIFSGLGFSVEYGPEIETDFYNFEALNVPKDHPARDMQDTFYVQDGRLLRTHTSPVQIHSMEAKKPPVYVIAPGAVYRRDNDVSHSPMFHQVEGLMVDEGITFGNLKAVLSVFLQEMFGKRPVRFRPSFFPFTEPSAEVDIRCVICEGDGCPVCKQSGWVEILGCGMVDPEVFTSVGYDSKKCTGFAFGVGVERVAMLKYGINDIRLFYEGDLRFLEQF